ncbi:isochorismate synthase [Ktedonospora formicarum]|uniref:isochorismate synthase n=1 Tax=Ktedonospora formicarum TaxID=2778364 RepID=A0A8J3MP01_9CHLR|nr:isochorismate synthase [Ktedonospora formicarum]GHO43332.1 isochorismate synthase [Ktedonospora formicarum]
METVFSDRATPLSDTTHAWPIACERGFLLNLLQRAAARARQHKHSILTMLKIPVKPRDALQIFRAFQILEMGERFFWEKPASQQALVGVGSALSISSDDTSGKRFQEITEALCVLRDFTLTETTSSSLPASRPLLFGGFAFDPQRQGTALWQDFPPGLLILPQLLYRFEDGQASLSFHIFIQPDVIPNELELQTTEILALFQRLSYIVEHLPTQQLEELSLQTVRLRKQEVLPASRWISIVDRAIEQMRQGAYQKIVLARQVEAHHPDGPFDIETTLYRLRQSYPDTFVFAFQRGKRYFVGATPERLVSARGGKLLTMALAGSAPRGITPEEDELISQEQLYGAKIRHEHYFVVELIRDALHELCSQVTIAEAPRVRKLKNIQHLETPIEGTLRSGRTILEAVSRLHPTPAVGGVPREVALSEIRAHEELDRGWYAGPVGWVDVDGDGEFAVALRSALLAGSKATLFAGNGIVASSDPEAEYTETGWKLPVMLRSLGDEE